MLYGRALHAAAHEALSRLLQEGRLGERDEAAVLAAFERVGKVGVCMKARSVLFGFWSSA